MNSSGEDFIDVSHISFEGDFYAQIDSILQYIRLSREQVQDLRFLFEDIEEALRVKWRDCKVYPFGSIVTGLGIKSSDADCYVDLQDSHQNAKVNVRQIQYILAQHPKKFQQLFSIVNAKVPIVQFFHVPTQTRGDISCSGHMAVRNSYLINYLIQSDKRVLQFSLIVKYWSKVHKLTGSNLLPNYALLLLIIFFLQVQNILPSIQWLQQEKWKRVDIYQDWDIGYMSDRCYLPISNNSSSLHKLLGEFFKYYSKFDFENDVICPYLGFTVKKVIFDSIETCPKSFRLYIDNVFINKKEFPLRTKSEICIQDMFVHSRNCAVGVQKKLATNIKSYFKLAETIFENCQATGNFDTFLKDLLTKKPEGIVQYVPSIRKHNQKLKRCKSERQKIHQQNRMKAFKNKIKNKQV